MAAVAVTAVVLLGTRSGEPAARREPSPDADRVVAGPEATPFLLAGNRRGLDEVLVLAQPLADGGGALLVLDMRVGSSEHRIAGPEEWPAGIVDATSDADHPDAEAAARSPDGTRTAVFTRSSTDRTTGISIHTEGQPARQFHRMQSVTDLVSRRLVWSPESDAVYFLAASAEGSADRVIGIPVGGSPQTVGTFGQRGFYGIDVVPSLADAGSPQPSTP